MCRRVSHVRTPSIRALKGATSATGRCPPGRTGSLPQSEDGTCGVRPPSGLGLGVGSKYTLRESSCLVYIDMLDLFQDQRGPRLTQLGNRPNLNGQNPLGEESCIHRIG
jgi:hypothetical protein